MPSDAEEIQDHALDRQEALRLNCGLEPAHLSLSLSGWLVGDFSSVVRVARGVVRYGRHHAAMGRSVAAELVGDEWSGFGSLCGQ